MHKTIEYSGTLAQPLHEVEIQANGQIRLLLKVLVRCKKNGVTDIGRRVASMDRLSNYATRELNEEIGLQEIRFKGSFAYAFFEPSLPGTTAITVIELGQGPAGESLCHQIDPFGRATMAPPEDLELMLVRLALTGTEADDVITRLLSNPTLDSGCARTGAACGGRDQLEYSIEPKEPQPQMPKSGFRNFQISQLWHR